jgi:transposase
MTGWLSLSHVLREEPRTPEVSLHDLGPRVSAPRIYTGRECGGPPRYDHPPVVRTPRIGGIHANSDTGQTRAGPPAGSHPKQYRRDVCALVLDQKRSVASVAKELGMAEQTIYLWLRQERIDRGEQEGLSTSERDEPNALRKETRKLREERDLLKKSWPCLPDQSTSTH